MQVIRTLGRGGFGVVELVEDQFGNQFARKTFSIHPQAQIPDELIDNARKRFIREAEVQSSINHPNIVPVFNVINTGDNPSYCMPVALATLAEDIKIHSYIDNSGLSPIMDIISALEELHTLAIYHRDLKPQNVLRLQNNNGVQFYAVSDFGLIATDDTQISVLTTTGMQKGSDFYTAPEIVKDLRKASPGSDIYSVGCILHDIFGVGEQRIPCQEIDEDKSNYSDILKFCTKAKVNKRFRSVIDLREAIIEASVNQQPYSPSTLQSFKFLHDDSYQRTDEEWASFCEYLDGADSNSKYEVYIRLPLLRIEELIARNYELARDLGQKYAEWTRDATLSFSNCDGIANRLEKFLNVNDISVKAEVLLALLFMGTSHNRWYVERMLFKHLSSNMEEALAKRLCIELRVLSQDACRAVDHLENSIGCSRSQFHPTIKSTLESICGK